MKVTYQYPFLSYIMKINEHFLKREQTCSSRMESKKCTCIIMLLKSLLFYKCFQRYTFEFFLGTLYYTRSYEVHSPFVHVKLLYNWWHVQCLLFQHFVGGKGPSEQFPNPIEQTTTPKPARPLPKRRRLFYENNTPTM